MVAKLPLLTNVSSYFQLWSNGSDVLVDIISEIPEVAFDHWTERFVQNEKQMQNHNCIHLYNDMRFHLCKQILHIDHVNTKHIVACD